MQISNTLCAFVQLQVEAMNWRTKAASAEQLLVSYIGEKAGRCTTWRKWNICIHSIEIDRIPARVCM
jgi:hypothetical protein